jgi:pimeloyl-ACP methyl ester carboxylesterase
MIETWTYRGDAVALRRFVAGEGPLLVLLPPHGRGPDDLLPLVAPLVAASYRVMRPEPRGFGPSRGPLDCTLADLADDVAAAIEAEGGGPVVVAGAAFGNRVARMLAVRRPELVRGLILMAAGGRYPPAPDAVAALRLVQNRAAAMSEREAAARTVLFSPGAVITLEEMRLDALSSDALKAQSTEGPRDTWWSGGTAPMLVIQGDADVLAPPENGRSLLRDYPDRVTLHEIQGGGHRIAEEQPALVGAVVVAWLSKSTEAGTAD